MKKRLTMTLASMFLFIGMALAQTTAHGVVVSAENGEPVIGATVKIVGTADGTITDVSGQFSIKVPSNDSQLEISYIGMISKTVKAGKNLRVELSSDSHDLDEVMVVAFGTAKKSAFTGSAKVVESEKLSLSQVSDVTAALAGAVAGVTLTSDNGGPDSSPKIRVRGFGSLNAGKDPLIIVDGAPYSGDLNNLNPNDVESMTVLKDAASSALYGARGANGVVIITTKRAKFGQSAEIVFDAKIGANSRALQQYDVIKSPAQYYEQHYKALYNYYTVKEQQTADDAWHNVNSMITGKPDNGGLGYNIWTVPTGQYLIGKNGRLNPNASLGYVQGDYYITPDDWEKAGTRTGLRQEYNISVNGATNKSNFYASLGYLENEGITAKSDFKRLSARLRGDYQAKNWLKVGGNMSYSRSESNSLNNNGEDSSTGNVWAFTSQMAPVYPLYVRNADGSLKVDDNGITMLDYGASEQYPKTSRPFITNANPILGNLLNTRNYEGNALSASGFADITFTPGLVLTVNASTNLNETRRIIVNNRYYGQYKNTGGTVNVTHYRQFSYNFQQLLNYTKSFNRLHNLNMMLGHEYYAYSLSWLSAGKSNMFSDDNKELDGAVVDGKNAHSYRERYNNEGYMARLQYDYDNKYYASASFRRDASSRFSVDRRWGNFWSLGGAWILSRENWYDVKALDMLKFKASIGSQGNDNIGDYRYSDLFTISNANGQVGTYFSKKGNSNITWETQTNFNTGFEFSLFKRITGSIEFYYRKTSDMLMEFTTAPTIGYTSYYSNVGDMYNTGFELDLQANIIHTKDIDWNVNFNISSIKNRISKLDPKNKSASYYTSDGKEKFGFTSDSFFVTEGESIYTWRMKEYAGVYSESTFALTGDTSYDPAKGGLSMWYKNTFDKENKWSGRKTTTNFTAADYYVTGETTVPKFQGGFGTSLRAYGFDLSINLSFQFGGKAYDSTYAQFMSSPTSAIGGYNYHKDLLDSWSVDNPNSNIPRFQYADNYSTATSTRFLTSSSYLNIENINFGYTLPASLTKKLFVNSLRIYVAAENLGYISARRGFDPRQTYSDVSSAANYSPMRTISGGVTVKF